MHIAFTWSETKRAANVKAHGLDFADAVGVFEGVTFSFEDDRFSYGEQRFVTLGLLAGIHVSVVHTESESLVSQRWEDGLLNRVLADFRPVLQFAQQC